MQEVLTFIVLLMSVWLILDMYYARVDNDMLATLVRGRDNHVDVGIGCFTLCSCVIGMNMNIKSLK